MKHPMTLVGTLLMLPALLVGTVTAGQIDPGLADDLESAGDGEFVSAIVYMLDRPDIKTLDAALRAERAPMSVRHPAILNELKLAAERSQPALLAYLDERVRDGSVEGYTPYWIMNLVVVSATKDELQNIAARPDVEAVGRNFRASLIKAVGDAYLGDPTAGIGITNSLRAINADRVWHELGITGAGTLIGGLDTGVQGTHPALSARWRGNTEPWQECWRDALGGGTQFPTDGNGHGTHTMGTMCGAGHATGDTVGVAFDALWIADNAINQGVGSGFDNDVVDAFQWFADPDGNPNTTDDVPDVVQNSWGIDSRFGGTYQDCDYRWQAVIEACEAAGVVVTFSAGNEGPGAQTHRSPANIANSPTVNFAVGAVDAENYGFPYPIASFSSRGPSDCDGLTIKPEVSAPGVSVYSSYPGGGYARLSGTSMAGPHVAGVAALMRQADPNADVQTIKSVLMSTAVDLGTNGEDNSYGWGVIDAFAAVSSLMAPDNESPQVTVTAPNGGEVLTVGSQFTITWNATDNVGVSQTDVSYSQDGGANYSTIATLGGNPGSYDWTVPNTPTTQALVKVIAYDAAGNQAEDVSDAVFTIEVSQGGPYVYVANIDMAIDTQGPWTKAVATVLVWDQDDQPVQGATVSAHWAGLSSDSDVFNTKRQGTGSAQSDKLRNPSGCWDFFIDDVSYSGHTFRDDLGETQDVICTTGELQPSIAGGLFLQRLSSNPVTGGASFAIDLPARARVVLRVHDVTGRLVRTLWDANLPAGRASVRWDGSNDDGDEVPNGIYFFRALVGGQERTEKLILLR